MCVAWIGGLTVQRGHPNPRRKEPRMAQSQHTPCLADLEEALIVLFCLIDDAYALLNPRAESYESINGFPTPRSSPSPSSSSLGG